MKWVCHKLWQTEIISIRLKKYKTDFADIETFLRLIQSVPNKKAEPIKMCLAKVLNQRMQEKN